MKSEARSGDLRRVGWVVDVQNDFMQPSGRLYVHDLSDARDPGAILVVPAIARAVTWMRTHCAVTVFTGDWHRYGDREIDPVHPDATRGTYPPHCMGLSPDPEERAGAQLMRSIAPEGDALVLPREASQDDARMVAARAARDRRPVFVQKAEFSVFDGNRAASALVEALAHELGGEVEFVVCGVATDVCVKSAVEGLLDRRYRVRVVPDATWGLGLLGSDETFGLWERRGAALTAVAQLEPND
jgi:nicotinamidase-related amidase